MIWLSVDLADTDHHLFLDLGSTLIEMLHQVAGEFRQTLEKTTADEWIRSRKIQSFELSGLQAVIGSVSHFRGHTQEITHMTRIQLGDAYEFDFVPGHEQQGGAVGRGERLRRFSFGDELTPLEGPYTPRRA